jgi:hypothetical protein
MVRVDTRYQGSVGGGSSCTRGKWPSNNQTEDLESRDETSHPFAKICVMPVRWSRCIRPTETHLKPQHFPDMAFVCIEKDVTSIRDLQEGSGHE